MWLDGGEAKGGSERAGKRSQILMASDHHRIVPLIPLFWSFPSLLPSASSAPSAPFLALASIFCDDDDKKDDGQLLITYRSPIRRKFCVYDLYLTDVALVCSSTSKCSMGKSTRLHTANKTNKQPNPANSINYKRRDPLQAAGCRAVCSTHEVCTSSH